MIAGIGVAYVLWGGLLAAVWADLFQGIALLLGGLLTLFIGINACGGPLEFFTRNADKMHMILAANHPELPWTVLIGGMWIPILYYCGLNQFITQRALAAGSLKQGQLGVIFAGALWLLIPFAIVMPGIVAHQLYGTQLERMDQAYPTLVRELIPTGVRGFILAALAGAVISTLASMLNSASTLFTMDLYKRYLRPAASEADLVYMGRLMTLVFLAIACFVALSDLLRGGVFKFIQEFQGFISPGIVAAFIFGFLVKKAPPAAGVAALVLSAPVYGCLQWLFSDIAYLHRMLITLCLILAIMTVITLLQPLKMPKMLPVRQDMDMNSSLLVILCGVAVVAAVLAFFLVFW
jgi:SSS family solute:Na+ symporter